MSKPKRKSVLRRIIEKRWSQTCLRRRNRQRNKKVRNLIKWKTCGSIIAKIFLILVPNLLQTQLLLRFQQMQQTQSRQLRQFQVRNPQQSLRTKPKLSLKNKFFVSHNLRLYSRRKTSHIHQQKIPTKYWLPSQKLTSASQLIRYWIRTRNHQLWESPCKLQKSQKMMPRTKLQDLLQMSKPKRKSVLRRIIEKRWSQTCLRRRNRQRNKKVRNLIKLKTCGRNSILIAKIFFILVPNLLQTQLLLRFQQIQMQTQSPQQSR